MEKVVTNEIRNFYEVLDLLGSVYDFLKDCTNAYKMMLKSPGHPGFSLDDFNKLEYLVSKARFLVSNLEEEYKEHEYSLADEGRAEKLVKNRYNAYASADNYAAATDGKNKRDKVFERLAHRMSSTELRKVLNAKSPKRTARKQGEQKNVLEDPLPSKADRLKIFIDSCLHKIYPRRAEAPAGAMVKRYFSPT